MGKKNLRNKYKNKKEESENEEEMDSTEADVFTINESYLIVHKLSSSNYSDRENITALLASHDFNPADEKMKEQLLNPELCRLLVSKLSDPFLQVRFNTISAIINLIVCYSEYNIDNFFLFDAGLLKGIENLFIEYFNCRDLNVKYTEGEQIKINKMMKSTIDLLLLTIELYDNDETKNYINLQFNIIIKSLVEIILNPGSLSEEVIINSCLFIANLLSLKVFKVEDANGNNLRSFIEFTNKIVIDKNAIKTANPVVVASFICSLFYINCNNFETESNTEFVKYLIEAIYSNINFDLGNQIEALNLGIQNYIKTVSNEDNDNMDEKNEKEGKDGKNDKSERNVCIKERMRNTEYNIRATLLYLKTFTDVINSVEIKSNNITNTNNMNTSYNMEDEDADNEEDFDTSDKNETEIEIEKNISLTINNVFQSTNYVGLNSMLKNDFLPNLVKFFDNLTVEEFLLNDFDKMIIIKELLYDLEYFTISLINNIIQNNDNLFTDNLNLLANISTSINKRLQIGEYSKNEDFLSVLLTCLRTIMDKHKNIFQVLSSLNASFDYKSLFVILNNNINDSFIKINIIDIITFIFTNSHSKEDNYEVCKLLYNMCMIEKDTEVLSHVLNAYFDIYKEDDYETNSILKSVGVIDLMRIGVSDFKTRIKDAYKLRELDKASYEYAKEALLNLKRFIKYKENLFKILNL